MFKYFLMSHNRDEICPVKANFAVECGRFGEKFNAGWTNLGRFKAIEEILNMLQNSGSSDLAFQTPLFARGTFLLLPAIGSF